MCGISGIINYTRKDITRHLKMMNRIQHHRGPDDTGFYYRDKFAFAHNRLSIIDVEGGKQPFICEKTGNALIFNGELYNFRDVRKELEDEFIFNTSSDTEVLLHAYTKWGIKCIEKFQGMFAFAIYDSRTEKIFIARDRIGIKPLFYFFDKENFIFSSELTPMMNSGLIRKSINKTALSSYLKYQYIPSPLSVYNSVYKLEPGHFIEVDLSKPLFNVSCYWQLNPEMKKGNTESYLEELNDILDKIIRIYTISDVDFGAFLSGGVDSSLITALMARSLKTQVKTFTMGYAEAKHSELKYAENASKILKTDHKAKIIEGNKSEEFLSILQKHFGEPFSDSSSIPAFHVCQTASENVKMVLSGDGGDELFGGYDCYSLLFRNMVNPVRKLPHSLIRFFKADFFPDFISKKADWHSKSLKEIHDSELTLYPDSCIKDLTGTLPFNPVVLLQEKHFQDPVSYFQYRDFKTYMVDDVLTKMDRMSMANSLEVRVPLLDHKLVEFAFSLPLNEKLSLNNKIMETKKLLKKSSERFFSKEFLSRKKMGFGIPLDEWMKSSLKSSITEHIKNKDNIIYDYLDPEKADTLFENYYKGDTRLSSRIWNIYQLSLWFNSVHNEKVIYND